MQAFPVQVKPVWAKPAQEKPFMGKKAPKARNLGRYLAGWAPRADAARTRPNRGVSRGDRGGVRGWCRVGLRTTSCWRVKLIYGFVGLFTGKNSVMLVFMFLNETKAAHLFERCEPESVLQICPQNCPQKGLERVSTMQHSFVHMGQNLFRVLVHNTTKPNKTAP